MPDRNPKNVFQQIMARETGKPVSKKGIANLLNQWEARMLRPAEQRRDILEEVVYDPVFRANMEANMENITGRLGNVEIEGSMKKGGMVKKTGVYLLHKGEKVIPANQVKKNKTKYKK